MDTSDRPTDDAAYRTLAAGHVPAGGVVPLAAATPARSRIFLRGLKLDACVGVYDWEQARPQPVAIDLEFGLPSELACHTDRLADAIDYAVVVERLAELARARHYDLVEALAETMALALQGEFGMPWLVLKVAKLAPFPGAEVGIVVERGRPA